MKPTTTLMPLLLLLLIACENKPTTDFSKIETIDYQVIGKDTCNKTDGKGKQGKWIPNYNNKLTDTAYYKDNVIISKINIKRAYP